MPAAAAVRRVGIPRARGGVSGCQYVPNGAAPGGSGIGGEFNLVPKRAPDEDVNRLTAGYENQSQGFGAADFSRRFGADREWGVR